MLTSFTLKQKQSCLISCNVAYFNPKSTDCHGTQRNAVLTTWLAFGRVDRLWLHVFYWVAARMYNTQHPLQERLTPCVLLLNWKFACRLRNVQVTTHWRLVISHSFRTSYVPHPNSFRNYFIWSTEYRMQTCW
jgi:hypothetical protein